MDAICADEAAFLASIRATPNDDVPRLVYADWLDEHDQADRAWFIRFQCDQANHGVHHGAHEYDVLERHVEAWLGIAAITGRKKTPRRDWFLADHRPPNVVVWFGRTQTRNGSRRRLDLHVRRGFVSKVECDFQFALSQLRDLVRRPPAAVQRVMLTDEAPVLSRGGLWTWFDHHSPLADELRGRQGYMPGDLVAMMRKKGDPPHEARFETCDGALAAMSEALIAAAWE